MSAEDLKAIQTAFTDLDAAMVAETSAKVGTAKARKAVEAIEAAMVRSLPVGQKVEVLGTRFTLLNDGKNVEILETPPVLSLEDLAK